MEKSNIPFLFQLIYVPAKFCKMMKQIYVLFCEYIIDDFMKLLKYLLHRYPCSPSPIVVILSLHCMIVPRP